jgi:hypothetical protein
VNKLGKSFGQGFKPSASRASTADRGRLLAIAAAAPGRPGLDSGVRRNGAADAGCL